MEQEFKSKDIPLAVWLPIVLVTAFLVGYLAQTRLNSWWPYQGRNDNSFTSIDFSDIRERFDSTRDWQTYRNEEYGFEVKYPKKFDIYSVDFVSYKNYQIEPRLVIGKDYIKTEDYSVSLAFIEVPKKTSENSTDTWVEKMRTYEVTGHTFIKNCEVKQIGNHNGALCKGQVSDEGSNSELQVFYIQTDKGGFEVWSEYLKSFSPNIFDDKPSIVSTPAEKSQPFFDLVDQILSTFKFIE